MQNSEIEMTPKTTSYLEWSNKLYTQIKPADIDISYWKKLKLDRIDYPVKRKIRNKDMTVSNIAVSHSTLDKENTTALKLIAANEYDASMEEILLSLLVVSLHDILSLNNILIELESHGRAELFEDVDLARTIGFFTNQTPLLFKYKEDIKTTINSTKEILRSIPHKGIHYSIAKYILNMDIPNFNSQFSFNYQGETSSHVNPGTLLKPLPKTDFILPIHPLNYFPCILHLAPGIYDSQIKIMFVYNKKYIKTGIIDSLLETYMNTLKEMIND